MTHNITLTLDEDIIAEARALAAKEGLSVSALLCRELTRLVEREQDYVRVHQSYVRRSPQPLGGGPLPSRDELHDRA